MLGVDALHNIVNISDRPERSTTERRVVEGATHHEQFDPTDQILNIRNHYLIPPSEVGFARVVNRVFVHCVGHQVGGIETEGFPEFGT